ncbi:MAG: hypothetical protein WBM69_09460 [Desulfobacterales bacterium]
MEKGQKVALLAICVNLVLFDGKGPFYVFSNAAVENLQSEKETIEEAL